MTSLESARHACVTRAHVTRARVCMGVGGREGAREGAQEVGGWVVTSLLALELLQLLLRPRVIDVRLHRVACCTLFVACCILYAACCAVHVAFSKLHQCVLHVV